MGPWVLTSLHSCFAKLAKTPLIPALRDSAPRGHECSVQMREGGNLCWSKKEKNRHASAFGQEQPENDGLFFPICSLDRTTAKFSPLSSLSSHIC